MVRVFIDGSTGTTALRIEERLMKRGDVDLIQIPEHLRKELKARQEALNDCDVAFLCLPDEAAREASAMVQNPNVIIIDASTAHRTNPSWTYGLPELGQVQREKLKTAKRIAVPGCHASGIIALLKPLRDAGLLTEAAKLSAFSLTGYSGGGKSMIGDYEAGDRATEYSAPRHYALGQKHKHLAEITFQLGLTADPIFCPVVADYYCGMLVTIPLFASDLSRQMPLAELRELYRTYYPGPLLRYVESQDENGFVAANRLSGKDGMEISLNGNEARFVLTASYDNLGKGASGAAVQCMNIALGLEETLGLEL